MMTSRLDIVLACALLAGFVVVCALFLVLVLRFGPRRGTWNQPAAAFARPGRRMQGSMYAIALLHVVAGVVLAVALPGGTSLGALVVLCAMAVFYVLCAQAATVARVTSRGRRAAVVAPEDRR